MHKGQAAMRFLRGLGRFFWRFMIIFSFIVNLILVVVLVGALLFIFEIKKSIADPLIGGLHSTAVGLENATIDWTIPVRDTIPVNLDVKLDTDTVVVLTSPVPLQVNATIDLPGINAYGVAANVNLTLPAGLVLPVHLNLDVPVREPALPVSLDVRAIIPLRETQLADPIRELALLFEPLAIGLHNLPNDFNETFTAFGELWRGEKKMEDFNLLSTDGTGGINDEPYQPWPGYSRTAGVNYTLFNQPVPQANQPIYTGIVPPGGIPFLDSMLAARRSLYENNTTPQQVNEQAMTNLNAQGVEPIYYNGTMADYYRSIQAGVPTVPETVPVQQTDDGGVIVPTTVDQSSTLPPMVGGPDIVPTSPSPQEDGIVPTAPGG
jgi:hypothetical protein